MFKKKKTNVCLINEEDIKSLANYIREGQKRVDDARNVLFANTNDFDLWQELAIKKHYYFILDEESKIMEFINKYHKEILAERNSVLSYEEIIELIDDLEIPTLDKELLLIDIKKEMVELNFGSMTIDW